MMLSCMKPIVLAGIPVNHKQSAMLSIPRGNLEGCFQSGWDRVLLSTIYIIFKRAVLNIHRMDSYTLFIVYKFKKIEYLSEYFVCNRLDNLPSSLG